MSLERNDVALKIFLKLLENEKVFGSFLHDEMCKITSMIDLSYKASEVFIEKAKVTDVDQ